MAIYLADDVVVQIKKNDDIYSKGNLYLFGLLKDNPDILLIEHSDEIFIGIPHSQFAHFVHMIMMNNLSCINVIYTEVIPMVIDGDTYNSQAVILSTLKV